MDPLLFTSVLARLQTGNPLVDSLLTTLFMTLLASLATTGLWGKLKAKLALWFTRVSTRTLVIDRVCTGTNAINSSYNNFFWECPIHRALSRSLWVAV